MKVILQNLWFSFLEHITRDSCFSTLHIMILRYETKYRPYHVENGSDCNIA